MTTSNSRERPFARPDASAARGNEPAFVAAARRAPNGSPVPPEDCKNFLGPDGEFNGTLIVQDDVRLEGTFKGEIRTEGTVQVVSGAEVNAKVQADFAVVGGKFEGEVRAKRRVDLLATSRVQAKLMTTGFSVEPGASFDGQVEMNKGG